ncbi:hypothetical protein CHH28_02235 [Bacterioplanes sanyensis]|uniref:Uncharacterized protein n=1 Tax=Bacterioplanes sanyensis TaxID=1249553 RepID=A0A222FH47_9GAMM|nr:hypothetical protein [Bacterioplanes sanyensis]ASP37563.1 hypothetical protein CHH28_02235 [Bacterioplanes sanyensis]
MNTAPLSVLISCPQRRYQLPALIHSPSEINPTLQQCIRRYRAHAFPEQVQLQRWVMQHLASKQQQLAREQPHWTANECFVRARELLQAQAAQQQFLFGIASHVTLSVGIENGPDAYFVDVDNFAVPCPQLTALQCRDLWLRMQELRDTFAGIRI